MEANFIKFFLVAAVFCLSTEKVFSATTVEVEISRLGYRQPYISSYDVPSSSSGSASYVNSGLLEQGRWSSPIYEAPNYKLYYGGSASPSGYYAVAQPSYGSSQRLYYY
jgi:hypothetical protein